MTWNSVSIFNLSLDIKFTVSFPGFSIDYEQTHHLMVGDPEPAGNDLANFGHKDATKPLVDFEQGEQVGPFKAGGANGTGANNRSCVAIRRNQRRPAEYIAGGERGYRFALLALGIDVDQNIHPAVKEQIEHMSRITLFENETTRLKANLSGDGGQILHRRIGEIGEKGKIL
jgi:hypothetical protein